MTLYFIFIWPSDIFTIVMTLLTFLCRFSLYHDFLAQKTCMPGCCLLTLHILIWPSLMPEVLLPPLSVCLFSLLFLIFFLPYTAVSANKLCPGTRFSLWDACAMARVALCLGSAPTVTICLPYDFIQLPFLPWSLLRSSREHSPEITLYSQNSFSSFENYSQSLSLL